jgi:thiazole synthase
MSEVRITLNGKPRSVSTDLSIASLLQEMGLEPAHVAVEHNQEVIPRRTWPEAKIRDGDRIEVVTFMGGGSGSSGGDALVIGGKTSGSDCWSGQGSIDPSRKPARPSRPPVPRS